MKAARIRYFGERALRPVVLLIVSIALLIVSIAGLAMAPRATARQDRQDDGRRAEQTQRLEGEAILALADAALGGKNVPADFQVGWHNDFLKAQRGTFIPFTLTIDASQFSQPAALVYVRAVRREAPASAFRNDRAKSIRIRREPGEDEFAVDAIFPAELAVEPGQVARVSRGFTLVAGSYDVFVVVRERVAGAGQPRATVLKQALAVPDFSTPGLATSSVIVADRLDVLSQPVASEELAERPYVIGQNDITPAADRNFRRNEELIVVFLIYHPFVTQERKFDLQVEYHFFRRGGSKAVDQPAGQGPSHPAARDGEQYFNQTEPQRFNPGVLGGQFDPAGGHPVMAGQGVPLSGFEEGEYRLAIRVTDVLAGTSIVRDVHFTVGS